MFKLISIVGFKDHFKHFRAYVLQEFKYKKIRSRIQPTIKKYQLPKECVIPQQYFVPIVF